MIGLRYKIGILNQRSAQKGKNMEPQALLIEEKTTGTVDGK